MMESYYLLRVTIANWGLYVIHDVEVEWCQQAVLTGKHVTFTEILPMRTEQISMHISGPDLAEQMSVMVRFRDRDDILCLRDTSSGDLREISEGGEETS
jgi:hypothetical protein